MSESGFITVHLHGSLKKHCPQPFKVKARTLRQALTALQTIEAFNPQKTQRKIPVRVDHFATPSQLDDVWGREEVHLRPEPGFAGAGLGDVFRVIVGVVLLVAAVFLVPATGGGSLTLAKVGMATLAVVSATAGSYFLMTGLQGLLYGKPTNDAPQEQERNYFGNYQQTTQAGTSIPIILGVHKWGGHLISFGMDVRPGSKHVLPEKSDVGGWDYYDATNRAPLPEKLTWDVFSNAFNP